jgi:hypothetical protein
MNIKITVLGCDAVLFGRQGPSFPEDNAHSSFRVKKEAMQGRKLQI